MLQTQVLPSRYTRPTRRNTVQAFAAKGFGTVRKAAPQPKPQKDQPAPEPCPCDSGKAYKNCCEPVHRGVSVASTPEATLRARFSALVKGEAEYVIDTTHPDYHIYHYQVPIPGGAIEQLREDTAEGCNKFAYAGLKVVANEPGVNELEGYVSFEYLHRKRSAPGALLSEEEAKDVSAWSRTAQKCRFLRTGSGVWQFVDYQTATFDANMLSGVEAERH